MEKPKHFEGIAVIGAGNMATAEINKYIPVDKKVVVVDDNERGILKQAAGYANDFIDTGLIEDLKNIEKLMAMNDYGGIMEKEIRREANRTNPNPHNQTKFTYPDNFVIYATNQASANAQYAKIMKKKNKKQL